MKASQMNYAPFSMKQLQVLSWWTDNSPYKNYETLICDGSVRAGKTLTMSMSYILWSMNHYNRQNFGMAGKTIGSLRRNVVTPLKRMLDGRNYVVKDKRSENILEITYGDVTNYYYLFGGKDESSQDLVQGITVAGFFFDEVALMPKSFVNQATSRASVDGSKFWFNCNPAGPYHWFKTEWIDKLDEKKALHIHFMMKDNPSLTKDTIDRYERMYSGVFYERYILGLWAMADGIVYDNFDKSTMVSNDPSGPAKKYYVSVDYGTKNPTAFLLWGLYGDIWYCLKEYYYDGRHRSKQKTDEQYAQDLIKFIDNRKVTIIIDPSAASFITRLRQLGMNVVKANNDVLNGIRETQSAMNEHKIMFTPNLPNLFKELMSYIWDEKAAEHGEDKVVKQFDHALDAVRYFVFKVIRKHKDSGVQLYEF